MASVKRYDANGPMDWDAEGTYVLASDYDRLVDVCRELVGNIDCTHVTLGKKRRELKVKAIALIGEGGE